MEYSITELKSRAYDLVMMVQAANSELQAINKKLDEMTRELQETSKKVEEPKVEDAPESDKE